MLHNWIPPARFLPYLTPDEVRDMPRKDDTVVLQPIAAIEQHGPHLPLAVDTSIVCGVLGKALERLDPALPAYCLPPSATANRTSTRASRDDHAHREDAARSLAEVCDSLHASGFRRSRS